MADALKVEAAVAIAAAANPVTMLRIMMLLLLSGDAPQPLRMKLGSSHRVAACGIVARRGTAGRDEELSVDGSQSGRKNSPARRAGE